MSSTDPITDGDGLAHLRPGTILDHNPKFPSVDHITDEGRVAALKNFIEVSGMSQAQAEMIIVIVARDWEHGAEERAMKALLHHIDLVGTYRVLAAMLAPSTTK